MAIFTNEYTGTDILHKLLSAVANQRTITALVDKSSNDEDILIRKQLMKIGGIGFVTGMPGGLAAIPSAVADLYSLLYNQAKMVAGIAHIRGYDLNDKNVQYTIIMCLLGEKAMGNLVKKTTAISVSSTAAVCVTSEAGQALLRRLAEYFGIMVGKQSASTGMAHLIPIGGGLFCCGLDVYKTRKVAKLAKEVFVSVDMPKA